MLPFLVLLGLVVLGFTFSMHLLMQHAPQGGGYFDDELLSLYNVVNMGFRFVPPNSTLMRSYWQASVRKYVGAGGGQRRAAVSRDACLLTARACFLIWQVILLYEIFMMLVQIVMLNLLIAFMAQLLGQLRANAQLMAHYERAILVIEQEQMLMSRRNLEQRKKQQRKGQRGLR